jgi:hypothetical protein
LAPVARFTSFKDFCDPSIEGNLDAGDRGQIRVVKGDCSGIDLIGGFSRET